jgi:hypothetical protein
MKAYGGVDVYIHIFLTSALAGGDWSASRPCCFTPGERTPGSHLVRKLSGPQSLSGRCPSWESWPLGCPACHYNNWDTLALTNLGTLNFVNYGHHTCFFSFSASFRFSSSSASLCLFCSNSHSSRICNCNSKRLQEKLQNAHKTIKQSLHSNC